MGFKIGGNTVIDNSRNGKFNIASIKSYTTEQLNSTPGTAVGQIVYNSDTQILSHWNGSTWFTNQDELATDGLITYLDAANPDSYNSGSTDIWYDLSDKGNNFYFYNNPIYVTNSPAENGSTAAEIQFLKPNSQYKTTNHRYARRESSTAWQGIRSSGTFQIFFKPLVTVKDNERIISVADANGTGSSGLKTPARDWNNYMVAAGTGGNDGSLSLNYHYDIFLAESGPKYYSNYWYNFTWTWDYFTGNWIQKYYRDTTLEQTESSQNAPTLSDQISTITLATNCNSGFNKQQESASIAVSQFLIYDRALTEDEVISNVNYIKNTRFPGTTFT